MIRSRIGKQVIDHHLLGKLRKGLISGKAHLTLDEITNAKRTDKGAVEVLCRGYALQGDFSKLRQLCKQNGLNTATIVNDALNWGQDYITTSKAISLINGYDTNPDTVSKVLIKYLDNKRANFKPNWKIMFPLFMKSSKSEIVAKKVASFIKSQISAYRVLEELPKPIQHGIILELLKGLELKTPGEVKELLKAIRGPCHSTVMAALVLPRHPQEINYFIDAFSSTTIYGRSASDIEELISMFSCLKQNPHRSPMPQQLLQVCLTSNHITRKLLSQLLDLKGFNERQKDQIRSLMLQKGTEELDERCIDPPSNIAVDKEFPETFFILKSNEISENVFFPNYNILKTRSSILEFTDPSAVCFMNEHTFLTYLEKLTWAPNGTCDESEVKSMAEVAITSVMSWLDVRTTVRSEVMQKVCSLGIRVGKGHPQQVAELMRSVERHIDVLGNAFKNDLALMCLFFVVYSTLKKDGHVPSISLPLLLNNIFMKLSLKNTKERSRARKAQCKLVILVLEAASKSEVFLERELVGEAIVKFFTNSGERSPNVVSRCVAAAAISSPVAIPKLMEYFLSCATCETSSPVFFGSILTAASRPLVVHSFMSDSDHHNCISAYRETLMRYIPIWLSSGRIQNSRDWTDLIVGISQVGIKLPTSLLQQVISFVMSRHDVLNLHLAFIIQALCLFGDNGSLLRPVIEKLRQRHQKIERVTPKMATILIKNLSPTGIALPPELVLLNTRQTDFVWKLNSKPETFFGEVAQQGLTRD